MKTYPLCDARGTKVAFEVDNTFVRMSSLAKALQSHADVSIIRQRKLFEHGDVHLWFCYKSVQYILWEPFGDNSRYWIGPEGEVSAATLEHINEIERVFAEI